MAGLQSPSKQSSGCAVLVFTSDGRKWRTGDGHKAGIKRKSLPGCRHTTLHLLLLLLDWTSSHDYCKTLYLIHKLLVQFHCIVGTCKTNYYSGIKDQPRAPGGSY